MIKHCGNCLHKDLSTAKEPCITCICDKRGLAFGVPNGPNEIYQFSMNFLESKDIKVIGNIYENPELLSN